MHGTLIFARGGVWLGPLLVAIGCGPGGPATYPVSGTVSFDDQPVAQGDILFIPKDPALGAEGGKIVEGEFAMRSKGGECRVEIRALNIGPDTEWMMGSPIAENFIPERYNDRSELVVEVSPDGKNVFDFQLQGQ